MELDRVLRYFVVQVFTVNLDSYLGRTGHNYFLYEEKRAAEHAALGL